jgi:L-2-hydroxyglutarate oxidase
VRGLIYPVPDPRLPFLGIHFTRRVSGEVEAGPNAVLALKREGYRWTDVSMRDLLAMAAFPGFWRMAAGHVGVGFREVHRSLRRRRLLQDMRRLIPEVELRDLLPGRSGVRAQAVERDGRLIDDFRVLQRGREIHVVNAPSPAATASLAIARHIVDEFIRPGK